jgi:hypothetical protein
MSDEKLAVDEMDIHFDAIEALVEGIEKWAGVQIVVVGVRPRQNVRLSDRRDRKRGERKEEDGPGDPSDHERTSLSLS